MKNLSILWMLLGVVTFASAQKKDAQSLGGIQYTQYPEEFLPKDVKTYKVIGKGYYGDQYRSDEITEKAVLYGYEKVHNTKEADIRIEIEEYPVRDEHDYPERKSQEKKVKKDGVERSVTEYYYVNSYKYKYKYQMFNKNDELIYETACEGVEKVSGGSSESASTARKDFDDKLNKSKSELIGACMTTLNRNSNDKYGYPVFTLNVSAFTIKPKKFNYDEFNKAFDVLKAAVSKSNSTKQDVSQIEGDLTPILAVYDKEIATMQDDKKARITPKLASCAYYNKALALIVMKKYKEASEQLQKSKAIDKVGFTNYLEDVLSKMIKRNEGYLEYTAAAN